MVVVKGDRREMNRGRVEDPWTFEAVAHPIMIRLRGELPLTPVGGPSQAPTSILGSTSPVQIGSGVDTRLS